MKKIAIIAALLSQVACAQMAMQAFQKHPSEDDISSMKIGETTLKDIKAKYSGYTTTMVPEKTCLIWHKVGAASVVGSSKGSGVSGLCFKDGLLADKNHAVN
ncbi:hypothetical protein BDW_04660 [Bdellovibrio bacteriovorus W]|nr:hypothetical protein BDW_04660 [Bdellovibrio bacteriovorus W]